MPTDTTIIDRLREIGDRLANGTWAQTCHDAADALTAAHAALAECYRLTGADPDGDEDWRLAPHAVAEVKRLREESDAAHAARDVLAHYASMDPHMPIPGGLTRDELYSQLTEDELAREECAIALTKYEELLTTALRERDEARAAIPRGTGVSP